VKEPLNLIISGVGGQGNVLISELIGEILVREGYNVTAGETYGVSQRGGAVTSHIRISQGKKCGPLVPDGDADIVLGLEPLETLRVLGKYGNPDIRTVTNIRPIYPINVLSGEAKYPTSDELKESISALSSKAWFLDASDIAAGLGATVSANMVMLGALVATELVPFSKEHIEGQLKMSMSGGRLKLNLQALDKGFKTLGSVFYTDNGPDR
jgi:indolepyruvate ferredoxin oxidoreductase beta subunit